MPALAKRLDEFQVSASVVMAVKGRELAAKGVEVISLASGEPDFPTPPHAIEAAADHAMDRLRDLADRFLFGDAPFTARPHPGRTPAGREYEHLSRLAEWSGAEDAEAGS